MVILVQPNTRHRTPDTDSGHPLKGGVLSCPFCPPDISGQCPVLSGLSGQLHFTLERSRLYIAGAPKRGGWEKNL